MAAIPGDQVKVTVVLRPILHSFTSEAGIVHFLWARHLVVSNINKVLALM